MDATLPPSPPTAKETKCAVSYVIFGDSSSVFQVLRPASDADLPNVWGLPAGYHNANLSTSWADSVVISGRQKLGVELTVVKEIADGVTERPGYYLHMKQFEVTVAAGTPAVPQSDQSVTQYQECKFASPANLEEAASRGSLCSRLFLALQQETARLSNCR